MTIGRCGKISTALLVALLSVLLALAGKLSQYEGRPNSPAPPEAIPIWKNSDLTVLNRIIEYAFPLIAPVGTMTKCPVDDESIDQECMEHARSAIREGSAGPWQTMLDAGTHRETVIVIDEGKGESGLGRPPLEVVLVQPINATISEMANLPLIVWIHGGGFVAGAARDSYMLGMMQGLAEKGNVPYDKAVWASIEYPLAPEYKYPAAPDACFRALQYLAREYQLTDPSTGTSVRLGGGGLHIGGGSAGATLSLLAGQKALQDGIRVDSLLLDTLVLPISPNQRDSSLSMSVFDSPSYRRNFYTRVPPVEWSNWIVGALTGCETRDNNSQCRQDVFGGTALSIEHWEQLADFPPVVVVTDKGCCFRDTALPFIQMYKSIAGEDKIRHVDAKASHALHLLFDSDSSEEIAKLWGGLVSSRSCSFGTTTPSFE